MEPLKLHANDTADAVTAKVLRRFYQRQAQVQREREAKRLIERHDAAWRRRLLGTLGALLDQLQQQRITPDEDVETADGGVVKLVVSDSKLVGGVFIRVPCPWVYRQPFLRSEDVD